MSWPERRRGVAAIPRPGEWAIQACPGRLPGPLRQPKTLAQGPLRFVDGVHAEIDVRGCVGRIGITTRKNGLRNARSGALA